MKLTLQYLVIVVLALVVIGVWSVSMSRVAGHENPAYELCLQITAFGWGSADTSLAMFWFAVLAVSFTLAMLNVVEVLLKGLKREYVPALKEYHKESTWPEKATSAITYEVDRRSYGRGRPALEKHERVYGIGQSYGMIMAFMMICISLGLWWGGALGNSLCADEGYNCSRAVDPTEGQVLGSSFVLSLIAAPLLWLLLRKRGVTFSLGSYVAISIVAGFAVFAFLSTSCFLFIG